MAWRLERGTRTENPGPPRAAAAAGIPPAPTTPSTTMTPIETRLRTILPRGILAHRRPERKREPALRGVAPAGGAPLQVLEDALGVADRLAADHQHRYVALAGERVDLAAVAGWATGADQARAGGGGPRRGGRRPPSAGPWGAVSGRATASRPPSAAAVRRGWGCPLPRNAQYPPAASPPTPRLLRPRRVSG